MEENALIYVPLYLHKLKSHLAFQVRLFQILVDDSWFFPRTKKNLSGRQISRQTRRVAQRQVWLTGKRQKMAGTKIQRLGTKIERQWIMIRYVFQFQLLGVFGSSIAPDKITIFLNNLVGNQGLKKDGQHACQEVFNSEYNFNVSINNLYHFFLCETSFCE